MQQSLELVPRSNDRLLILSPIPPSRGRSFEAKNDQFDFPRFLNVHVVEKILNFRDPVEEILYMRISIEQRDIHL